MKYYWKIFGNLAPPNGRRYSMFIEESEDDGFEEKVQSVLDAALLKEPGMRADRIVLMSIVPPSDRHRIITSFDIVDGKAIV